MWTTQLRNHSTIICTIFLVLVLSWQWDLDNVIVGIVEWDLDNIIVGIVEYRILWCYISAHVVGEGGPVKSFKLYRRNNYSDNPVCLSVYSGPLVQIILFTIDFGYCWSVCVLHMSLSLSLSLSLCRLMERHLCLSILKLFPLTPISWHSLYIPYIIRSY